VEHGAGALRREGALARARARGVHRRRDEEATVVVPNDQLALAIGKEGLNARLATRLTGWKIDIQSEQEFAQAEAELAYAGSEDGEEFSGRCAAVLSNGKRCPNAALPGSPVLRRAGAPGAREPAAAAEEPSEDDEPVDEVEEVEELEEVVAAEAQLEVAAVVEDAAEHEEESRDEA
jgi:N utilization substance protein A